MNVCFGLLHKSASQPDSSLNEGNCRIGWSVVEGQLNEVSAERIELFGLGRQYFPSYQFSRDNSKSVSMPFRDDSALKERNNVGMLLIWLK